MVLIVSRGYVCRHCLPFYKENTKPITFNTHNELDRHCREKGHSHGD